MIPAENYTETKIPNWEARFIEEMVCRIARDVWRSSSSNFKIRVYVSGLYEQARTAMRAAKHVCFALHPSHEYTITATLIRRFLLHLKTGLSQNPTRLKILDLEEDSTLQRRAFLKLEYEFKYLWDEQNPELAQSDHCRGLEPLGHQFRIRFKSCKIDLERGLRRCDRLD